jgi:NAD(P)-dependent dehydrogenase (short-subunit alcohol dehydrogenase family)
MSQTGLLDGKVAIVTGAGVGLGRAHALALAAAGATVVVNNRAPRDSGGAQPQQRSSVELLADEIVAGGGRALADTASVTDWAAMGRLVSRAVDEFGRLDIVINNAGILVWELIADTDEASFDELMAINVKGAFALTHHACRHWRALARHGERANGRIINTVSGIGLYGFPRGGLYAASKGAILSMTMVTAMEMRPYGVTANAIWPEARTRMGKGIFPEAPEEPDAFDAYDPDNISPLAVYLASDAGGWLTGQVIYIQGDRVRRMEAWRPLGEHRSAGGRSFDVAELGDALALLYGTLPALQPETSLADATEGIDPGRPDA